MDTQTQGWSQGWTHGQDGLRAGLGAGGALGPAGDTARGANKATKCHRLGQPPVWVQGHRDIPGVQIGTSSVWGQDTGTGTWGHHRDGDRDMGTVPEWGQ